MHYFAKYVFYDIINNQYYEYHVATHRNYSAFTNRIVKIIKNLNITIIISEEITL